MVDYNDDLQKTVVDFLIKKYWDGHPYLSYSYNIFEEDCKNLSIRYRFELGDNASVFEIYKKHLEAVVRNEIFDSGIEHVIGYDSIALDYYYNVYCSEHFLPKKFKKQEFVASFPECIIKSFMEHQKEFLVSLIISDEAYISSFLLNNDHDSLFTEEHLSIIEKEVNKLLESDMSVMKKMTSEMFIDLSRKLSDEVEINQNPSISM